MANDHKSRLDREIEEILEKKSREPIQFRSHPRVQEHQSKSTPDLQVKLRDGWQRLLAMPLALAYAAVILGVLVHDASPLAALLLSTVAVAALWVPGIRNLVQPTTAQSSGVKYWRGRPYTTEIKSAVSRSPIDSLKRYFDRRR